MEFLHDISGYVASIVSSPEFNEALKINFIKYFWLVILWPFRWVLLNPIVFAVKYLFSEQFGDIRRISGEYYLYHLPIMPELTQRKNLTAKIRLSKMKIKVHLRSISVSQHECIGTDTVGYKGDITFKKEFVYIAAVGVMDRYTGNVKYLTLYRTYFPHSSKGVASKVYASMTRNVRRLKTDPAVPSPNPVNLGMCGAMTGISNANNIYQLKVILSRYPLSYPEAERLLQELTSDGTTVPVMKSIRRELEAMPQLTLDTVKHDFESPFG
ncbi:hypothetical protein [Rhizobium herbae]|uniref:Uncharacterized protein n=1 Tax=Rhizobium herbae TaxID=508661 RepID=A0ABS4EUE2_9HYPH|nr:hypothetical protein [Rhizobium herbae]MBP1861574.1 hypothetical protein [Rhizobium herbae]